MPKVFDVREWFADITKGVELPEEVAKAALSALDRDEVRNNIGNQVLRQDDYSRNLDELKTQRTVLEEQQAEVERLKTEAAVFVKRQQDRDHNNVQLHEQLTENLATANRKLVELGEDKVRTVDTKPPVDEPKYVTVDELTEMRAEADQRAIAFANRIVNLGNKHRKDFGEDLDPDVLVQHATTKQMTLDEAYRDMFSEQYADKTEAEVKERIKTAVDDAETELRSQVEFPETNQGPSRVNIFDIPADEQLKDSQSRVAASIAGLKDIRSGKKEIAGWITD